jgi:hypothetical protein
LETTLHRQLKERFGPDSGGRSEVVVGKFRIDAVDVDGTLIEVQSAPLGALRSKLSRLLVDHKVRVVKPVITARRVVRRARLDGPDLSARLSPKRGALLDVFDDLVGLARVFPHPNLQLEVLGVEIDEIRVLRRRPPGFTVGDRGLRQVGATVSLCEPDDLWRLLPDGLAAIPFTTRELAERLERPLTFAQRVAYCFRMAGAVEQIGTRQRHRVYLARTSCLSRFEACRSE